MENEIKKTLPRHIGTFGVGKSIGFSVAAFSRIPFERGDCFVLLAFPLCRRSLPSLTAIFYTEKDFLTLSAIEAAGPQAPELLILRAIPLQNSESHKTIKDTLWFGDTNRLVSWVDDRIVWTCIHFTKTDRVNSPVLTLVLQQLVLGHKCSHHRLLHSHMFIEKNIGRILDDAN